MKYLLRIFSFILLATFMVACSQQSAREKTRVPLKTIKIPPKLHIAKIWHTEVGNGNGKKNYVLAPDVNGSIAYVSAANGFLQAINLQNGSTIWSKRIAGSLISSPSSDQSMVYVADSQGQLHAIDRNSGNKSWTTDPLGIVLASPSTRGEVIVSRTLNGKTYGLGRNGAVLWEYNRKTPAISAQGYAQPVFYKDAVLIGMDNGFLLSLNYLNGKPNWSEAIAFPQGLSLVRNMVDVDATPLVEGNRVYVASLHGNITKINAMTGEALWYGPYSTVQTPANHPYMLVATSEEGFVTGFNKVTGQMMFEHKFLKDYDLIGPVLQGNHVAVGIKNHNALFWFDARTGYIMAKSQVTGKEIMSIRSSPYGILVYCNDGTLSLHRAIR